MDELPFEDMEPAPSATIEAWIAATNHTLPSAYSHRLTLELEIARGRLPADTELRRSLLIEPFEALCPEIDRGAADTRTDRRTRNGCLGTVLALFLIGSLLGAASRRSCSEETLFWVLAATASVGLVYTIWQHQLSARRWLEEHALPHLASALEPLRPTHDEIEKILVEFRPRWPRFAKILHPDLFDRASSDGDSEER